MGKEDRIFDKVGELTQQEANWDTQGRWFRSTISDAYTLHSRDGYKPAAKN